MFPVSGERLASRGPGEVEDVKVGLTNGTELEEHLIGDLVSFGLARSSGVLGSEGVPHVMVTIKVSE